MVNMTHELATQLNYLYMRSQSKRFIENPRVHYTALAMEDGTYLAIVREDGYVEDDFIKGMLLPKDEYDYYDVP